MRILLTGASSFTGFWFAKALVNAGHQVVCSFTGRLDRYQGVRKRRVQELSSICEFVPNAPFGSEAFINLLHDHGPWTLLCHHGAEVTNYKSPEFDVHRALLNNALNLRSVLAAFKHAQGRGVILTGSVFEQDEGAGDEPLRAFSPYGLSKGLTWQVFRYYCAEAGIPLGKFVIPNPFGPYEEPRFTAYLMTTWQQMGVATVRTPDYVRDNIHVALLAEVYKRFAAQVAQADKPILKCNPSGYVESQGAFAQRVAREVRTRTGWPCELQLQRQTEFAEPLVRHNFEPATQQVEHWNETAAWDAFVEYYLKALAQCHSVG